MQTGKNVGSEDRQHKLPAELTYANPRPFNRLHRREL
jgi:hypothetical protein